MKKKLYKEGKILPSSYLEISEYSQIYKSSMGLLIINKEKKPMPINEEGFLILNLCNGIRTYDEILEKIEKIKNIRLNNQDTDNIELFFQKCLKNNILKTNINPKKCKHSLKIQNGKEKFKYIRAIIELTDKCNLECSYCYREAGKETNNVLINTIGLLRDLKNQGVIAIELSGGEPLLHPNFNKIFKYALEEFSNISLLTNGILLNENIIKIMSKHKNKLVVQVSLPSLNREKFKFITGYDLINKVISGIKLLKNEGIRFRIGTVIIDDDGINELESIAKFSIENKAIKFAPTPVMDFGRGIRHLNNNSLNDNYLSNKILELSNKYKNLISIVDTEKKQKRINIVNCGAGSDSITIDPLKKLRPCPLFPMEFSGNALNDYNLRLKLSKIESPGGDICDKCEYYYYCYFCIIRGWNKYIEIKEKCKWAKKYDIDKIFSELKG